jgi:hypothetical protein
MKESNLRSVRTFPCDLKGSRTKLQDHVVNTFGHRRLDDSVHYDDKSVLFCSLYLVIIRRVIHIHYFLRFIWLPSFHFLISWSRVITSLESRVKKNRHQSLNGIRQVVYSLHLWSIRHSSSGMIYPTLMPQAVLMSVSCFRMNVFLIQTEGNQATN